MTLTTLFDGERAVRELAEGTYIIGRGESCRIRFASPEVSERHAILTIRDGKAILEDLHSANGTLVNGEPIDAAVFLDGGMVVQIGNGMLRVSDKEETDAVDDGGGEGPAGGEGAASRAEDPPPEPPETVDPLRDLRRSVPQSEIRLRKDAAAAIACAVAADCRGINNQFIVIAVIPRHIDSATLPYGTVVDDGRAGNGDRLNISIDPAAASRVGTPVGVGIV